MSTKQDLYRAGILEVRKAEFGGPGRGFGVWITPLKKWAWQGVKKDVAENAVYYFGQGDGQDLLLAAIGGHQDTAIQVAEMIQKGQVPPRPRKAVAPRAPKQTEDWIDIPLSDLPPMRVAVKKRFGDFVVHHTVIPEYPNAPAHVSEDSWAVSYKNGYIVSHHAEYLKRLGDAVGVAEKLAGEWGETFQKAMEGDASSMRQILDNIKKQLGVRDAIREYNRNPTCCGQGPRRNPAWADQILNRQLEPAMAFAKKQKLAAPDPGQPPNDHGWQKWLEFGCGSYGCVYPTSDPATVVKLTTDESEVQIARQLIGMGAKAPAGIVRYFGVFDTELSHNGSSVYLLWRESASQVGEYDGPMNEALGRLQEFASIAKNAITATRASDEKVSGMLKIAGYKVKRAGLEVPEHDPKGSDVVLGGKRSDVRNAATVLYNLNLGPHTDPVPGDGYANIAAAAWMAAIELAKRLKASKDLKLVGEAFLDMSKKGTLLADVRDANLGVVERSGKKHWVIVDPGFSVSTGNAQPVSTPSRQRSKLNPVRKEGTREYIVASLNGGERYEHMVKRRFGKLVAVKRGRFYFLLHETGMQVGTSSTTLESVTDKARFYNKAPRGVEVLAHALISWGTGGKDGWLDDLAQDRSYEAWAMGQRMEKLGTSLRGYMRSRPGHR